MSWLFAIFPALTWGSTGIVSSKLGGSTAQQTLGMSFGALIFGLSTLIIFVVPVAGTSFAFNTHILLVGFISGLLWAIGQAGQFAGFKYLGVSLGMPLSTGGQIVFNALMAAAVLGEWQTRRMWLFGGLAILLVLVGATLTSMPDKTALQPANQNFSWRSGIIAMLVSTVGYGLYFVFPNLLAKVGYITAGQKAAAHGVYYVTAVVAPQAIGQVLGALILAVVFMHEAKPFGRATWKNILTGLVWATGNLAMFISAANPKIGQATATTLTQMGIIVGVFGGVYILGEKKTHRQMRLALIGVLLVAAGGVLISMLPTL